MIDEDHMARALNGLKAIRLKKPVILLDFHQEDGPLSTIGGVPVADAPFISKEPIEGIRFYPLFDFKPYEPTLNRYLKAYRNDT
jgi:hypothetical protein